MHTCVYIHIYDRVEEARSTYDWYMCSNRITDISRHICIFLKFTYSGSPIHAGHCNIVQLKFRSLRLSPRRRYVSSTYRRGTGSLCCLRDIIIRATHLAGCITACLCSLSRRVLDASLHCYLLSSYEADPFARAFVTIFARFFIG